MTEIHEIQVALQRYEDRGITGGDEIIRLLTDEFGDLPIADVLKALRGQAKELGMRVEEMGSEIRASKKMMEMIRLAEKESGKDGLNTGEALTFLAGRGNAEAQAYLDQLTGPETQVFNADFRAAVEWHPGWHFSKDGVAHCDAGREFDTPEKLVQAYRHHKRGARKE